MANTQLPATTPSTQPIGLGDNPVLRTLEAVDAQKQLTKVKEIYDNIVPNGKNAGYTSDVAKDVVRHQEVVTKFKSYMEDRGESLDTHRAAAERHSAASDRDTFARDMVSWAQAGEDGWDAVVAGEGDTEMYSNGLDIGGDSNKFREAYTVDLAAKRAGYSPEDRASGVAEAELRHRTDAGETESTRDALYRWSNAHVAEKKSREDTREKVLMQAESRFFDAGADKPTLGDKHNPSDLLAKLSPEERTRAVQEQRLHTAHLEKTHGHLRPQVQRAMNTLIEQDGGTPPYKDVESYATMAELGEAMSTLSDSDFAKASEMLQKTAKLHGVNQDNTMKAVGMAFSRGAYAQAGRITTLHISKAQRDEAQMLDILTGGGAGGKKTPEFYAVEVTDKQGKVLGIDFTPRMTNAIAKSVAGSVGNLPLVGTLLGQTAKTFAGVGDKELSLGEAQHSADGAAGKGQKVRIITDRAELEAAYGELQNKTRYYERSTQIRDWRGAATTITSGNKVKDAFTTGVAGSLPEMATLAAGGVLGKGASRVSMGLITAARYEQNMADVRENLPRDRWEANKVNAMGGAAMYSYLAKLQVNTAFTGMGKTVALLKTKGALAQGVARAGYVLAAETVQEQAQEASFAVVSDLYGAVAEDIKDFGPAIGEGGYLTALVHSAPDTAIAMLPFALIGGMGRGATAYMSVKEIKSNLDNAEYLAALNVSDEQVAELKKMKPLDAAEWVKVHREEVFSEIVDLANKVVGDAENSPASFHTDKDGTVVTVDGKSEHAMSPEEAAERAMELDPSLDVDDSTQADLQSELEEETLDLRAMYEDSAIKFLKNKKEGEGLTVDETKELKRRIDAKDAKPPTKADEESKAHNEALNNDEYHAPIEENKNPEQVFEMALLPRALAGPDTAGESKADKKMGRPPVADTKTNRVTKKARNRYLWSKLLGGRKVGSKDINAEAVKSEDAALASQSSMNHLANAVHNSIRREAAKSPNASRDAVVQDLTGRADAAMKATPKDRPALLKKLPKDLRNLVIKSRKELDTLSQLLIDSGFMSKDLAEILGENVGTYMQRQFQVHQDTGWNYEGVKKNSPKLLADGIAHIAEVNKAKDIDLGAKILSDAKYLDDADNIAREMLDESENSGSSILFGSAQAGKANIKNFIKRKELTPEIRALLGEITDVGVNIKTTGGQQSKKLEAFKFQQNVAKLLIAAGLGSRTPNPKKRILEKNQVGGKDGQSNTAFAGFGKLFVTPEILDELNAYLTPNASGKTGVDAVLGLVRSAVTIGKFNQVVLSPQAYSSNFLGGIAFELAAGRVFNTNLGKSFKAYLQTVTKDNLIGKGVKKVTGSDRFLDNKHRTDPYTFTESIEYGEMTIDQVRKRDGDQADWRMEQLESVAEAGKLFNNSVFAGDIAAASENAALYDGLRTIIDGGGAVYQVTDNAAKAHALTVEKIKWFNALPGDTKMSVVIEKAVRDTRMTTQNYDMVYPWLKKSSANGLFAGSYISFSFELIRNSVNNIKLAWEEGRSGNPALRKNAAKRVVGMAATAAAMSALSAGLTALMSGMDLEEQDLLREVLPEWNKYTRVTMTGVDDQGHLGFFDGQYIIPQMYWYNALSQLGNEGSFADKGADLTMSLVDPFLDYNIFTQLVSGAIQNKKASGGKIYNEGSDNFFEMAGKQGANALNAMFKPGFMGTYKKATGYDEVNAYGGVYHKHEWMLNMVGIRINRMDITSEGFGKNMFDKFARTNRAFMSDVSKSKLANMSESEKVKATAKVNRGREESNTQLSRTVRMLRTPMMAKHISKDHIRHWAKKAKLPTWQRSYLEELLAD